jgi:hypothetical protein
MLTVCFHVCKIIEDVNTGGNETKQPKARKGSQKRIAVEELFIKYKCGKDEDILRPLPRAHGFQKGS